MIQPAIQWCPRCTPYSKCPECRARLLAEEAAKIEAARAELKQRRLTGFDLMAAKVEPPPQKPTPRPRPNPPRPVPAPRLFNPIDFVVPLEAEDVAELRAVIARVRAGEIRDRFRPTPPGCCLRCGLVVEWKNNGVQRGSTHVHPRPQP